MIPKGKLLALLLAFTAVGGLAVTGAFTTVEAERTADVSVEGDANALLAIEPKNNDTNDFVQQDSTGDAELEIDLTGDGNSLNADAATNEENIIKITNNGQNTVSFFIATDGGLQDGSVGADGSTDSISDANNVSDDVNVEFYIDDANVSQSVDDPLGDGSNPSAGDVVVHNDANDDPVTLANEVGDGDSNLDTFVDGKSGATSTDADYSISDQGDPSETPDSDASAVKLAPGQSVEISIYIEIDVDEDGTQIDLSDSGTPVLENIVIIASEDIDGNLVDLGERHNN